MERLLSFCSERFSGEGRELQIWQESRHPVTLHTPAISGAVLCNEMINKVGTKLFVMRFQSYSPAEVSDFMLALVLLSQSIWQKTHFSHCSSSKPVEEKIVFLLKH